jgi:hypothetical protein
VKALAFSILALSSAALAGAGTVTDLEGAATRQPKDARAPLELKVGDAVEVGDTLEVATGGNLAVTLTDQSVIALGEGSRLTLDEARFGDQGSTVFSAKLLLGSLWAKVTKLAAGSSSKFEVTTERAVAGVRGTIFTVDLASKDAEVDVGVEEGEVEVAHAVPDPEPRPVPMAVAGARSGEEPTAAGAMRAGRPDTFNQASGAGGAPQPRFPKVQRIAAGEAVVFGAKGLARHRFELRRARMAAFIGKHRDGWLRRSLERERERQRALRRDERREQRRRR